MDRAAGLEAEKDAAVHAAATAATVATQERTQLQHAAAAAVRDAIDELRARHERELADAAADAARERQRSVDAAVGACRHELKRVRDGDAARHFARVSDLQADHAKVLHDVRASAARLVHEHDAYVRSC